VNSRPFSVKVTDCSPFMSRTLPVTPYGLVALMSRLDMPGCKIETSEPVSIIRLLGIPCISTRTVGVPCSNTIETNDFMAALSGASRWKELPLFSTLTPFLDFSFYLTSRPFTWGELFPGECERFERSFGFLFPGASEGLCLFPSSGRALCSEVP